MRRSLKVAVKAPVADHAPEWPPPEEHGGKINRSQV
jgi:hypothetical protein